MIKKYTKLEELGHDFIADRVVVDVETIDSLKEVGWDASKLRPSVIGILKGDTILQIIVENPDELKEISKITKESLDECEEPFLAFNHEFDQKVLLGLTNHTYNFDEIQEFKYQKKEEAKKAHEIVCSDPFNGDGFQAIVEYKKYLENADKEALENVISHNQACLIIEYNLWKKKK